MWCSAQLSEVMLRLLRTEQTRCDLCGCLGSSISTHVIWERAAEQLLSHSGTRPLLGFTFSPLLKIGRGMDPKALCGWKGSWLSKQICQLVEVGMAGTECPYQGVLVAVCRTELTLFVLLLTHSYCMTFIEYQFWSVLFMCSFPDKLSRARALSGISTGSMSWKLPQPTSHKFQRCAQVCASDLLKAKKKKKQEWVFILKTPQNYYSTTLFSLKPVQVQKGSAYHQKETDFPHVQEEQIQAVKNVDCDQHWYLVLQNWILPFPGPRFVHLCL